MRKGNCAFLLIEELGAGHEEAGCEFYVKCGSGEFIPAANQDIIAEAKRIHSFSLKRGRRIENSDLAYEAIHSRLADRQHEVFACLFLDSQHRILDFAELFRGTIDGANVHPREVVKEALKCNAKAVIFAHNHPSGDSEPSQDDIQITAKLKSALALVDIKVLDHFIVGHELTSLSERGLI